MVEKRVKEIYAYAQRYADLIFDINPTLKKEECRAKVVIGVWDDGLYYGEVFPSIISLDGTNAVALTKGYHVKNNNLPDLLEKMLNETKKEYESYCNTVSRTLS